LRAAIAAGLLASDTWSQHLNVVPAEHPDDGGSDDGGSDEGGADEGADEGAGDTPWGAGIAAAKPARRATTRDRMKRILPKKIDKESENGEEESK
jgi:hypothetical protein